MIALSVLFGSSSAAWPLIMRRSHGSKTKLQSPAVMKFSSESVFVVLPSPSNIKTTRCQGSLCSGELPGHCMMSLPLQITITFIVWTHQIRYKVFRSELGVSDTSKYTTMYCVQSPNFIENILRLLLWFRCCVCILFRAARNCFSTPTFLKLFSPATPKT